MASLTMCSTSGGGQPPVDRDHHGVGLGDAEQQLEEDVAALVEMGDARLRLDAVGDQPVGDAARRAVELAHRWSCGRHGRGPRRRDGPLRVAARCLPGP